MTVPTTLAGKQLPKPERPIDWLVWIKEVEAKARVYDIWDQIDPKRPKAELAKPRDAPDPSDPHFAALDTLWWREKTVKQLLRAEIWASLPETAALRIDPLLLDLREMLLQVKQVLIPYDLALTLQLEASLRDLWATEVTRATRQQFLSEGQHLLLLKIESTENANVKDWAAFQGLDSMTKTVLRRNDSHLWSLLCALFPIQAPDKTTLERAAHIAAEEMPRASADKVRYYLARLAGEAADS